MSFVVIWISRGLGYFLWDILISYSLKSLVISFVHFPLITVLLCLVLQQLLDTEFEFSIETNGSMFLQHQDLPSCLKCLLHSAEPSFQWLLPSWREHVCPLTRAPLSPGPGSRRQQAKLVSFIVLLLWFRAFECYLYCRGSSFSQGVPDGGPAQCEASRADALLWTEVTPGLWETSAGRVDKHLSLWEWALLALQPCLMYALHLCSKKPSQPRFYHLEAIPSLDVEFFSLWNSEGKQGKTQHLVYLWLRGVCTCV